MKRWTVPALIALGMLVFAGTAASKGHHHRYGPYNGTSPDSGTCGPDWATDTFKRVFTVEENKDGTFTLREDFKHGTFVTVAGPSPGACETNGSKHGTLVNLGVTGKMHGYLLGTVTTVTGFDPAGGCGPGVCTTASFILTHFGPGATYSCVTGVPNDCRFSFKYSAGRKGLLFHHWRNQDRHPAVPGDENKGDIANS